MGVILIGIRAASKTTDAAKYAFSASDKNLKFGAHVIPASLEVIRPRAVIDTDSQDRVVSQTVMVAKRSSGETLVHIFIAGEGITSLMNLRYVFVWLLVNVFVTSNLPSSFIWLLSDTYTRLY